MDLRDVHAMWDALDADAEPAVVWPRPVEGRRAVIMLGAFDPPTRAHVAIATAAARTEGIPIALCLTKTVLARDDEVLLPASVRVEMLAAIAESSGFGLAFSNRGTYLEVGRALRETGTRATFVVGADKLEQLADPSFYPDGMTGVGATFAELDLLVVPRAGSIVDRTDLRVLDPSDMFDDRSTADISATQVRRLIAGGERVDHLVPPEVVRGLEGYTSAG